MSSINYFSVCEATVSLPCGYSVNCCQLLYKYFILEKKVHISAGGVNSSAVGSTKGNSIPSQRQNLLICLALFLISFAVYSNTLKNGYVLDDYAAITHNVLVAKGAAAIPELLTTPYHRGVTNENDTASINDLYRPLSLITFAVEQQMFNSSPSTGHLINVLLFGCCVVLLFLFLRTVFGPGYSEVAFIAALLFALHPIHTEVVANIKSRDELLCFFFVFCSLQAFLSYSKNGKIITLATGVFCYFLSLMSKETAICFLAVIPLVFLLFRNDDKKRTVILICASVLVAVVYLVIRHTVLKANHADNYSSIDFIDNQLAKAPSGLSRVATELVILGLYIKLLIIPYPLSCDYSFNTIPFTGFTDIWVWAALAFYLFLAWMSISRLKKKPADPIAFGILFFLATIILFSNLLFLIGSGMAERFAFFASAGFCLVVAQLLWNLLASNKNRTRILLLPVSVWLFVIPVAAIYAADTYSRNEDWEDNFTLFKTDLKTYPDNARLWYFLGYETGTVALEDAHGDTVKAQTIVEAISYFRKAISVYPDYTKAHNDIGNLYVKRLQFDSAEHHLKRAIELEPNNPVAVSDLGAIYFAQMKFKEAAEVARKALVISPGNTGIMNNLAFCYLQLKQFDSVISISDRVLALDKANKVALDNIAISKKEKGQADTARIKK